MPIEFTEPNHFIGVRVIGIDVNLERPSGAFFTGEYALEMKDGMRVKSAYPKQSWSQETMNALSELIERMELDLVQNFTGTDGALPQDDNTDEGEAELTFPR